MPIGPSGSALNNLATRLSEVGQREAALERNREAIETLRTVLSGPAAGVRCTGWCRCASSTWSAARSSGASRMASCSGRSSRCCSECRIATERVGPVMTR